MFPPNIGDAVVGAGVVVVLIANMLITPWANDDQGFASVDLKIDLFGSN
jgi:hypothetical protein